MNNAAPESDRSKQPETLPEKCLDLRQGEKFTKAGSNLEKGDLASEPD